MISNAGALKGSVGRPMAPELAAVPPYVGSAPFTGRADDLARLDEWARSPDPVMVVEAIGGTGKSALTWEWASNRASTMIDGSVGRLWWSFYDGSASMTSFLQEVLRYTGTYSEEDARRLNRATLTQEVIAVLRSRPYLIVLDGFERLLTAYHRFDPSKVQDHAVEVNERSLIEANADDIVRRLAAVGPSKVLVSTRLMPVALEGQFGRSMPGVRHIRLPGLTDDDVITLVSRLGVRGDDRAINRFFRSLENHPLLVGIVAGMVRDYRTVPGNFERWLDDPAAGGALSVSALDLKQYRTHILSAALDGLDPGARTVLGWISVLAGAASWDTLKAINPFLPERPAPVEPDLSVLGPEPTPASYWKSSGPPGTMSPADVHRRMAGNRKFFAWLEAADTLRARAVQDTKARIDAWLESDEVIRAATKLDTALKHLEDRGLLWWDRSSNNYDLHPIIRAYAYEQLETSDRVRANDRVHDHFQSLPPDNLDRAASVEELDQTITIFRALVGAQKYEKASAIWKDLSKTLLASLGAYTTAVELLQPLAVAGTRKVRSDLAIAYAALGQYDDAINLETRILGETLQQGGVIAAPLTRLAAAYYSIGALAAAYKCDDLRMEIATLQGQGESDRNKIENVVRAFNQGHTEEAARLISGIGTGSRFLKPWFADNVHYWKLRIAIALGEPLTHSRLDEVTAELQTGDYRRRLTGLRLGLYLRDGQYEEALAITENHDTLARKSGLVVIPATAAYLLAKLGRSTEAAAAVEESLARLPRVHPAKRPHYRLAQAFLELGRREDALTHASDAYRLAWADGPPNGLFWDLRNARELLEAMGEQVPDLPTIDAAGVRIPLESEIHALIAELAAKRREQSPGMHRGS
jgi:tetratricopeptide (TPR) repeat protein